MHRSGAGVRGLILALGWAMLAAGGGAPSMASTPGVAAISVGGSHACAVRANGTVWCWGNNFSGQLGDGTYGDAEKRRTAPVEVRRGSGVLRDITKVAAGSLHTCAVREDGRVLCWGDAYYGELGNGQSGTGLSRNSAVFVRRGNGFLTDVEQVTAGDQHSCALRQDGGVMCWGQAVDGQLGDGTTGDSSGLRAKAVRVRQGNGYLGDVRAIAAGERHTCAVKQDGSAWCWGSGRYGQLGDGTSGPRHQRTRATRVRRGSGYLTRISGIGAGSYHTCARRTDGTAWCWGQAFQGQLGDGTTGGDDSITARPTQVLRPSQALTGVSGIGSGALHTCVRRTDGSAWCWGSARAGQLGDGTTGDPTTNTRLKSVRVVRMSGTFSGVRRLDGGSAHTCALRTDRTVWCWGSNFSGQLGIGSADFDPHPYPLRVRFP